MFTSVLRRYVASTAISTQNFRKGADSMRLTGATSVDIRRQTHGDKECPFSGVTN